MIPFKFFAPALIGLTGIGWVISGIVQRPPALTIKDVVDMDPSGCIKSFHKDRDGFQPKINCGGGSGTTGCCPAKAK